jgi:DNA-directed RNA polymerase specialized sigma24 family protein
MHKASLDKILNLLGPDDDVAAAEYCKLHERISRFFEWNSIEDPEALADEVIDRLGRRVTEPHTKEHVRNLSVFALGIARLLLLEEFRRQKRQADTNRWWAEQRVNSSSDAEAFDKALEHCLKRLQPERRRLIERYYTFGDRKKAEIHQSLAEENEVTVHALRNRALRVRHDLEDCVRHFLSKQSP